MATIVIGDIHGRDDLLKALLDKIHTTLGYGNTLIHTGDLIDRGPGSKAVVQMCIDYSIKGILGNHELWLHQYLATGQFDEFALHKMMQGDKTLESYGITSRSPGEIERQLKHAIPKAHRDYILSLPVVLKVTAGGKTYRVIHAGFKNDAHAAAVHEGHGATEDEAVEFIARYSPASVLWTTNSWNNPDFYHFKDGSIQVIGHTPTPRGEPLITPRWIAVDCGCGTFRSTLGCVVLETGQVFTVNGLEIKGVKSGTHTDFTL